MQKNNATLIYELNTMKGTVESYLKTIAQRAIQNCKGRRTLADFFVATNRI